MNTKYEEKTFKTSELEAMKGMFTANRVCRSWNEDFADEDTGEIVSIERKEIILDRGTLLDSDALQTINFHLSTGDLLEIEVTNQQRCGVFNENWQHSIWIATASISGKKKNYFLYAKSVKMAFDIAIDFLEQSSLGSFGIAGIKEYDSAYMVPENEAAEEDMDNFEEFLDQEFYKIILKVDHDENEYEETFIVKTSDAEKGKQQIEASITKKFIADERPTDFTATIISAKTIPCESIIDLDFCKQYFDRAEEEKS